MGECNFYLKARFSTDADARAAVPRLVALLAEGERAHLYWQDARTCEDPPRCEPLPAADEFWSAFRARFPLVCRYLGELNGADEWDDELVGQLGQLVDPRPERLSDPSSSLVCRAGVLYLRLNRIWHFSQMHLLERFCAEELGAIAVGSSSREKLDRGDSDPFTLIDV
jgi:hypothetical protein